MASVGDASVGSAHMFRGSEYIVTLESQAGAVLVEVEDRLSADQWRATFDSACMYKLYVISQKYTSCILTVEIVIFKLKQHFEPTSVQNVFSYYFHVCYKCML